MTMRRKLIAGNWKMNGLRPFGATLARDLATRAAADRLPVDLLVCPPSTLLVTLAEILVGGVVKLGAQDCHAKEKGAHTGDISAAMLADAGCSHVILGHSERRTDHAETDAEVKAKATAALGAGLVPIICVGETEAERDAGRALDIVTRQIEGSLPVGATAAGVVIAYEPVWAIGTGRTPTTDDVAAMHDRIRAVAGARLGDAGALRILYGGSVKPSNAAEFLGLDDVDGALVGGASLVADDFWAIAKAG